MRPVLVELAGQPLRAIGTELQARRIPGPMPKCSARRESNTRSGGAFALS
jgi:hypothetical protein